MRHCGFLVLSCLLVMAVIAAAEGPAVAESSIIDIGTVNGRSSIGLGINAVGDVAGLSYVTGTVGEPNGPPAEPFIAHAVLFTGGGLRDLGAIEGGKICSPLGCESTGNDINDSDWVVGYNIGDYGLLASVWLPADAPGGVAGWNVLPPLSPTHNSVANAINNAGLIVGRTGDESSIPRAALWRLEASGPTLTDLGTLSPDGAGSAIANDVNDLGQIVGGASDAANPQGRGFLYLPEPAYGLPAGMNNLTSTFNQSAGAISINNKGEVVGGWAFGGAWVWLPAPAYGLPAGFSVLEFSDKIVAFFPSAISDAGQIVGQAWFLVNPHTGATEQKAVAWRNGRWVQLNDLLPANTPWDLVDGRAVVRVGKTTRITGVGLLSGVTDINGFSPASHGYVLTVTCTGDLNEDGDVDADDQLLLLTHFGQTVPAGTDGDLNGDGVVNQEDVQLLAKQFHQACI